MDGVVDRLPCIGLINFEKQFITVFQNYVEVLESGDQYAEMIVIGDTNIYLDGGMKYLAKTFDVSVTSAKIRLKNLGIIKIIDRNS